MEKRTKKALKLRDGLFLAIQKCGDKDLGLKVNSRNDRKEQIQGKF